MVTSRRRLLDDIEGWRRGGRFLFKEGTIVARFTHERDAFIAEKVIEDYRRLATATLSKDRDDGFTDL